jgi:hypothetical protein
MSTRGIRKERRDDYVINTKQMLSMDSDTLDEFENMCEKANDIGTILVGSLKINLKNN